MRNKSVAVLDIRSSEICAAIAERGVNNTFIIKSKYSRNYEGYAEGEILDLDDFVKAIRAVVSNAIGSVKAPVKQIYVGIPDEFCRVLQTDKVLSFPSARRVNEKHVQALCDSSLPKVEQNEKVVKSGALYYVLSDKRRVFNPIGAVTDSLRARISFLVCKTALTDTVYRALKSFTSIREFYWLPQNYTQGQYLFGSEKKGGYNLLLDIGYISSTFSVVCGNGIAFSEPFSIGIGHIALLLTEALNVPYDVALNILKKVNLNARDTEAEIEEITADGEEYRYQAAEIIEIIKEGLDGGVCEMIEVCLQSFTAKDMTGETIYVTGEGAQYIRGTLEHLSSRLVTPMEVIAPHLPYYDKPQFSSLFSLLNAALGGKSER